MKALLCFVGILFSVWLFGQKEIIINEEISVFCYQIKEGTAVLPKLKKDDIDEIFVEVPVFRGKCSIDVELMDEKGVPIVIMSRRKRNDALGLTIDPRDATSIYVTVFSQCDRMVMLNTVRGLINISGKSVVGRVELKVE
ncbi:MAG: hypothetical protein RIF46_13300 [Cyclobacteriaceae bacterium]